MTRRGNKDLHNPPRIVLWGTCDTGKPRMRILLEGLRENGADVIECRSDVWAGIEDKSQVKGPTRWLRLLWKIGSTYPTLAWRYLRLPRHDWVLVGYPAFVDVWVVRALAWLRRTPVAMDWFLSAYDTIVLDRRLLARNNPLAWLLWAAESICVRLPNRIFMDTHAHATRMESLFRLRHGRCDSVWVGAETAMFPSLPAAAADQGVERRFRVLFYGQFIPLHGIPTIIEAARLLRGEPVEWLLVGTGQEAPRVRAMLDADPLPRLRWLDWVEYPRLVECIREADLCLGIFGTSDKAASVIPNKVFQILSAGRPLLTRDSPAIHELPDAAMAKISLVTAGNARALADAIAQWPRRLPASDTRHDEVRDFIGPGAIGARLLSVLRKQAA